MNQLENRYTDPTWDYKTIWETIAEMQNHLAQMMDLLSSEEADAGNEKVDRRLLEWTAKAEGYCFLIEKTLKGEEDVDIHPNFMIEQQLEAISHSSTETVLLLKSIDFKLAAIHNVASRVDLTFNSQSS